MPLMLDKIDLMIIGAQKAGTTALKNYLNEHPEILGHPQTEFDFFNTDSEYNKGFEYAIKKYFTEGDKSTAKIIAAKYVSIYYNDDLLKKLALHNPNCKLVFIIREPVARAYSAYTMEIFSGWLKRDSLEIIDAIKTNNYNDTMYRLFVKMGLYDDHITMIYKYFPKNQVRIVLYEDLQKNSLEVSQDIFNWVGVDSTFMPNISKKHNETKMSKSKLLSDLILSIQNENNIIKRIAKKILPYNIFTKLGNTIVEYNKADKKHEPISKELYEFLHDFYKPHNERFTELTGIDLSHWNK